MTLLVSDYDVSPEERFADKWEILFSQGVTEGKLEILKKDYYFFSKDHSFRISSDFQAITAGMNYLSFLKKFIDNQPSLDKLGTLELKQNIVICNLALGKELSPKIKNWCEKHQEIFLKKGDDFVSFVNSGAYQYPLGKKLHDYFNSVLEKSIVLLEEKGETFP